MRPIRATVSSPAQAPRKLPWGPVKLGEAHEPRWRWSLGAAARISGRRPDWFTRATVVLGVTTIRPACSRASAGPTSPPGWPGRPRSPPTRQGGGALRRDADAWPGRSARPPAVLGPGGGGRGARLPERRGGRRRGDMTLSSGDNVDPVELERAGAATGEELETFCRHGLAATAWPPTRSRGPSRSSETCRARPRARCCGAVCASSTARNWLDPVGSRPVPC